MTFQGKISSGCEWKQMFRVHNIQTNKIHKEHQHKSIYVYIDIYFDPNSGGVGRWMRKSTYKHAPFIVPTEPWHRFIVIALPHVQMHKMISSPSLAFYKFNCNVANVYIIHGMECPCTHFNSVWLANQTLVRSLSPIALWHYSCFIGPFTRTLKIRNGSSAMNFKFPE